MALSDIPKMFFVTFVFLCIGTLFLLIGFATPNWVDVGGSSFGLWRLCVAGRQCEALPVTALGTKSGLIAMQALSCIALLLAAGSVVAALAFIPMKTRQKTLGYVIAAGSVVSASCNGVTDGLFWFAYWLDDIYVSSTLGYSFILSAIATAPIALASILAFVMACNIRPENALPSDGVILYNPQETHENSQYTGTQYPQAQYNLNTVPGQYGHQQAYAVPAAGPQYPGAGVVYENPQGTHENPQHAGA